MKGSGVRFMVRLSEISGLIGLRFVSQEFR